MEILPMDETQTRYSYTSISIVGTVLSAYVGEAYGVWLPFVVMSAWALFLMWDMYLYDVFFGAPEMEDESIQHSLEDWLAGRKEAAAQELSSMMRRAHNELDVLKQEIKEAKRLQEESNGE